MAARIPFSITSKFTQKSCPYSYNNKFNPFKKYYPNRTYIQEHASNKQFFTFNRMIKISVVGMGIGGAVYLYQHKRNSHAASPESLILSEVPDLKPSRSIVYNNDTSGLNLTLYQYQTCPFCCKVRTFLEYRQISHNIVEVNPVTRKQLKFSKYRKVPILISSGKINQQLNDSSMIISALQSLLLDNKKSLADIASYYPILSSQDEHGKDNAEILNKYFLMLDNVELQQNKEEIIEERKWRLWADNVLVHILSPNVYRTPSEALQAFSYFSDVGQWKEHFSTFERLMVIYVGAFAMYLVSKRLKKRHNLRNDVRQSFYEACNEWMHAVGKKRKFMGGNNPNLADLAVYGILSSVEGCNAFNDVLNNTKIGSWYYDMKNVITLSQSN